jgi:hypothetical protein
MLGAREAAGLALVSFRGSLGLGVETERGGLLVPAALAWSRLSASIARTRVVTCHAPRVTAAESAGAEPGTDAARPGAAQPATGSGAAGAGHRPGPAASDLTFRGR